MVCFFVPRDAGLPWDPVDLGCDAVGEESLRRSVHPPCYCLLRIGAPEEGFCCNSCCLLLYASACLAANHCCLESEIAGAGVSPDSLISAHSGVVGSAPRMDLA